MWLLLLSFFNDFESKWNIEDLWYDIRKTLLFDAFLIMMRFDINSLSKIWK